METKYEWKKMPEFDQDDYLHGRRKEDRKIFVVEDKTTGMEYEGPQGCIVGYDINEFEKRTIGYVLCDEMQNEEFMKWATCTSEYFIVYVDKKWFTSSFMNYVVDNFQYPEIFEEARNPKFGTYMTKDMWLRAFKRNKEVIRYMPVKYIDKQMLESAKDLKNLALRKINYIKFDSNLFSKIYFNCDREHKLILIPPITSHSAKPNNTLKSLVTKEIADDILSIDIRTIWNVPKEFITKENAIKAMNTDILLMKYVPAEYQTLEYQQKAIEKKPTNLSIIDPNALDDSVIYSALEKRGFALSCVPVERRTGDICEIAVKQNGTVIKYVPEYLITPHILELAVNSNENALMYIPEKFITMQLCEYAVKCHAIALSYVPKQFINEQMCLNAVISNMRTIKYVPVIYITLDFIEKIKQANVEILSIYKSYFNACLEANRILESDNMENLNSSVEPQVELNINAANIPLASLPPLFSFNSSLLSFLSMNNIKTIGDLSIKYQNNELFNLLGKNKFSGYYFDILSTIKLLRCKYLNIDPLVDFNPDKPIRETLDDFGLSRRTKSVIMQSFNNSQMFLDILKDKEMVSKLSSIPEMNYYMLEEIIFKISIIINYYKNKKKAKENLTDDEMIALLNDELIQTQNELNNINNQVTGVLGAIKEEQNKEKKVVL